MNDWDLWIPWKSDLFKSHFKFVIPSTPAILFPSFRRPSSKTKRLFFSLIWLNTNDLLQKPGLSNIYLLVSVSCSSIILKRMLISFFTSQVMNLWCASVRICDVVWLYPPSMVSFVQVKFWGFVSVMMVIFSGDVRALLSFAAVELTRMQGLSPWAIFLICFMRGCFSWPSYGTLQWGILGVAISEIHRLMQIPYQGCFISTFVFFVW